MCLLFKRLTAAVILVFALSFSSVFADTDNLNKTLQYSVILKESYPYALVNGIKTPIDAAQGGSAPFVSKGRTFVPARFISEAFRASVDWDSITSTINIKLNGDTISFKTGSSTMYVDGIEFQTDSPAQIVNGRVFVPLRTLSEALGKAVRWEGGIIFISDHEMVVQKSDLSILNLFFNQDIRGNTSSNIINGGFVCEYEGWTYYVNEADNDKIYRMNEDKSGIEKISEIECIRNINAVGGFIYAEGQLDGMQNDGIYKININSFNDYELLVENAKHPAVMGDYIYYINDEYDYYSLCRVKTDSSEPVILYEKNCKSFDIVGDHIFFIDEFYIGGGSIPTYTLYKMDICGENLRKIDDVIPFEITIAGDWLYYTHGEIPSNDMSNLFKYNILTGEKIKLTDKPVSSYNIYGNWIYYTLRSNDENDKTDELCRMNLNGLENTRIKDVQFYDFNIAGDWIYYNIQHEGCDSFHRMSLDGSKVEDL